MKHRSHRNARMYADSPEEMAIQGATHLGFGTIGEEELRVMCMDHPIKGGSFANPSILMVGQYLTAEVFMIRHWVMGLPVTELFVVSDLARKVDLRPLFQHAGGDAEHFMLPGEHATVLGTIKTALHIV